MLELFAILFFLLASGFFSGAETGAYSVDGLRLRYRVRCGDPAAARVKRLLEHPRDLITTYLVGTNLAVFGVSMVATLVAEDWLPPARAELVAGIVMAPVITLAAELLPKDLFRVHAEVLYYRTAGLSIFFRALFAPVVAVIRAYGRLLDRLLHGGPPGRETFLTEGRLHFYLATGVEEGVLTRQQDTMTRNILGLRELTVRDVMLPLERVALVKSNMDADAVLAQARGRRHTRYPVYQRNRRAIIGVVNIHDIAFAERPGLPVRSLMREPAWISAETSVPAAIAALRSHRQPLGVVGEDERAVGIVTLRDLLEVIVGELEPKGV